MITLDTRNGATRALVTGGAQGVGLAVARQLVDEGCKALVLLGRSEAKGQAAVAELEKKGAETIFISADLADPAACLAAVEAGVKRFGSLNALVNAAASAARGSLVETTPDMFDEMFAINVRGPFFLMQGLVKHLLATGQAGSIVNVLSVNVHGGQSFLSSYSASKGALATLTKNVANAYRRNRIRCNAVLPGWMDTPGEADTQAKFHGAGPDWLARAEAAAPMGQLVKTHEMAGLITYMLSPQSGVMTGALVDYDQNVPGIIGE
ncbi:MAG TPA: SDR family oxidoreductase [Mesorhizobium sp.]|jgi:NAD(P)-dependent dehydrogenase (short-subunit alcohol dehydrogenase family)|uniref:SDR family oxidoreductase n=1 Tax=Mesorhizobium sp. TaxID=1871066 RepID=UPI002DDC9B86|nr:SDR family oxidoreductase [Mesorhizobium sp.]HEV2505858.1 SDR family oxidoreductase [Mesorhizobium sp.]